jgi:NADH-quinone oxidoreductase subunit C
MQDKHERLAEKIEAEFPDVVEEIVDFRGERTFVVAAPQVKAVCEWLRGEGYDLLEDIVGDDMLPDFPRFAVNYHIYSIPDNHRFRLRALVEDPEEGPETVASVWATANWLEMEVWDLMGIRFQGNENLRRLFLPEDWQGHPLRKDYPLGYEEVQFSFNWEAIDARKPYAKD